uniref:Uncharacterized protein n=1 Tax=Parascaris univalens TaxID=6257 RepID=A0A915C970_PARUN
MVVTLAFPCIAANRIRSGQRSTAESPKIVTSFRSNIDRLREINSTSTKVKAIVAQTGRHVFMLITKMTFHTKKRETIIHKDELSHEKA